MTFEFFWISGWYQLHLYLDDLEFRKWIIGSSEQNPKGCAGIYRKKTKWQKENSKISIIGKEVQKSLDSVHTKEKHLERCVLSLAGRCMTVSSLTSLYPETRADWHHLVPLTHTLPFSSMYQQCRLGYHAFLPLLYLFPHHLRTSCHILLTPPPTPPLSSPHLTNTFPYLPRGHICSELSVCSFKFSWTSEENSDV